MCLFCIVYVNFWFQLYVSILVLCYFHFALFALLLFYPTNHELVLLKVSS